MTSSYIVAVGFQVVDENKGGFEGVAEKRSKSRGSQGPVGDQRGGGLFLSKGEGEIMKVPMSVEISSFYGAPQRSLHRMCVYT